MSEEISLFRVIGLRYVGPSATKSGYSDKLWAAVLLKRERTGPAPTTQAWRFVSVWGPTTGTLRPTLQPWTSVDEANRRFEEELRKKEFEGYERINWRNFTRLERSVNSLGAPLPASAPAPAPVSAAGDAARKAWRTRRANAATRTPSVETPDNRANEALANINLAIPPKPKPEPAPEPPRMRSIRRDLKELLES